MVRFHGQFWVFFWWSNALPDANQQFYSPTLSIGWLIVPSYLLTGDGFAKSDASAYRAIYLLSLLSFFWYWGLCRFSHFTCVSVVDFYYFYRWGSFSLCSPLVTGLRLHPLTRGCGGHINPTGEC